MSLAEELLEHARFLANLDERTTTQANIRRAISAAYYAVFHLLVAEVAAQVSPDSPTGLREGTHRVLNHTQMSNVATAFSRTGANKVKYTPKDFVLPDPISKELASIAKGFEELQAARHTADYDVMKQHYPADALSLVRKAESIFKDWKAEKGSRNAPVFLAALIFGKDWNK
jgi:uncharacterized protein (UPF0332 family)